MPMTQKQWIRLLDNKGCSSSPARTSEVSDWLGHADPAFTLRAYVHLMDAGLGDADFVDTLIDPSKENE